MIYRSFGNRMECFGNRYGNLEYRQSMGELSEAEAYATVMSAYENGINIFDTAEAYGIPYGLSEKRLGVALTGIRHRVYVVSKIGLWGARTGQKVPKTTVDMIRLCAHASLYRLRSDFIDVMLCHEYDIKDPSIYLEAFELLKKSGEIREYGISTDDLEVLKRFNQNGNCAVVELDYSLINRKAEEGLLQYCMENNIAVLVRGPLAKGLLSGRYTKDHIFSDSVRKAYNEGELRNQFIEKIEKVDKVREVLDEDDNMADIALRYIISHESAPVAIPGAKSPEQAENANRAGPCLTSRN